MKAKFLVFGLGLGLTLMVACNKDNTDILNTIENPTRTDTTRITCDSNFYVRIGTQIDSSGSQSTVTLTASVLSGRQPYRFRWSNGDTLSSTRATTAGTFSVTVTDANGCTVNNSVVIPSQTDCSNFRATISRNGNTSTANVTGGRSPYRYVWSTGGTMQSIVTSSPGTYSVTVVDANNCTATQYVTIGGTTNCANFRATINAFDSTNSAMLWVNPSNGTAPYTFSWSNGSTASYLTPTTNGLYRVTITDANGCSATDELNVSWSRTCGTMTLRFNVGSDSTTVTAMPALGTAPYRYLWSNGATTNSVQVTTSNPYNVTATDSRGCNVNGRFQF